MDPQWTVKEVKDSSPPMKHVYTKTISSRSHKLKNTITSKEAKDSYPVDQVHLKYPSKDAEDSSLKSLAYN